MIKYSRLQTVDNTSYIPPASGGETEITMEELRLGQIEAKFANIIWDNAPLSTSLLVSLCEDKLGWKRTTTYTVLKRLSDRGLFINDGGIVRVIINKEEFYTKQSETVIKEGFSDHLPSFLAAFTSKRKLNQKEIEEIEHLIEEMKKES